MATEEDEKELPPEEELLGETEAVDEKEKDDDLEQEGEDQTIYIIYNGTGNTAHMSIRGKNNYIIGIQLTYVQNDIYELAITDLVRWIIVSFIIK